MCVNAKMIPVETPPVIRVEGGKEKRRKVEGVNSSMIYLIHYNNLCNATMYPT
jgi:hypothetical protein